VAQNKDFSQFFKDFSVYIHKRNSKVTFFCPLKYFDVSIKSNPVVGPMLAGVINYQPAQIYIISPLACGQC